MSRPLAIAAALLACLTATLALAQSPWITRSNEAANILLEVQAKYVPEGSSGLGVERYDDLVLDLKPAVVAR